MEFSAVYILKFFVLIVSLTFHEAAHAWAAYRLGDETAARLGRMSLNPLVHLDVMGTLMFLFQAPIGWAKPVPVNPLNLRNRISSMQLVSFAGPMSNLILCLVACMAWYFLMFRISPGSGWYTLMQLFIATNLSLAIFNLLPIHPLDGASVITYFMSDSVARRFEDTMLRLGPFPLIVIVLFETLPGMGLIELWFRLWKPFFSPLLELFNVWPGVISYWR